MNKLQQILMHSIWHYWERLKIKWNEKNMLQKSRKITVLMLAILVIYSIVANYSLVSHAQMYYYIVNPLFWFIFIIATGLLLFKTNESTKLGKDVLEYTVIASLIYVGIYIVSQFFIEIRKKSIFYFF